MAKLASELTNLAELTNFTVQFEITGIGRTCQNIKTNRCCRAKGADHDYCNEGLGYRDTARDGRYRISGARQPETFCLRVPQCRGGVHADGIPHAGDSRTVCG